MSTALRSKQNFYYFIENDARSIKHEEEELADHLCEYLVNEYKDLLNYDRSALVRMEAADKISYYSNNDYDLDYLKEAAKLDVNPNVRTAAKYSVKKMEKKIYSYK